MSAGTISKPLVRYHRNGTHGAGFHSVAFTFGRGKNSRQLLAMVFGETGEDDCAAMGQPVAVIDPAKPWERWDGPYFEPDLRAAIKAATGSDSTYGDTAHRPIWESLA